MISRELLKFAAETNENGQHLHTLKEICSKFAEFLKQQEFEDVEALKEDPDYIKLWVGYASRVQVRMFLIK